MKKDNLDIDRKISNVLEYLSISIKEKIKTKQGVIGVEEVKKNIRKILGIDKQCFQCLEDRFDYELILMEETKQYICQDCIERLIQNGGGADD